VNHSHLYPLTFSISVSLPYSWQKVKDCPNLKIPTSSWGLFSDTKQIQAACIIEDVDVSVLMDHTLLEDIDITIVSPRGTRAVVFSFQCGTNYNLNATFDDEASGNIVCASPTVGTAQPYEALRAFHGEDALGTWRIEINDEYRLDGGVLKCWGLRFDCQGPGSYLSPEPTPQPTPEPTRLTPKFERVRTTWYFLC
jgi:subtilisin-like proprotein convertase family protein